MAASEVGGIPTAIEGAADPFQGDYQRVILLSWDGVRRDVLYEMLEVADPSAPCWDTADIYPMDTGRLDARGAPIYTCLPTLAGLKPISAPVDSPDYGPFQVIASHVTNTGSAFTKPQHATILSGYEVEDHGQTANTSRARMPEGATIYERLMNAIDPPDERGRRNGFILRTHHSGSKKFVGPQFYYWAKSSRALQTATGRGREFDGCAGALKRARKSLDRWKRDAEARRLPDPGFFMFLHFKTPDWNGHLNGDSSRQYRLGIYQTDERLYGLLENLREHGWEDTPILITTDHGFLHLHHFRNAGRTVINTWIAARGVTLTTDHIPVRTEADYCASQQDPEDCAANGPEIPMPPEDAVPNVLATFVTPTILYMFGVEWRSSAPQLHGQSLYLSDAG